MIEYLNYLAGQTSSTLSGKNIKFRIWKKIKNGYKLLSIDYVDKFGPSGVIGAILLKLNPDSLYIDSFLCCRVLGRNVEHSIFSNLRKNISKL